MSMFLDRASQNKTCKVSQRHSFCSDPLPAEPSNHRTEKGEKEEITLNLTKPKSCKISNTKGIALSPSSIKKVLHSSNDIHNRKCHATDSQLAYQNGFKKRIDSFSQYLLKAEVARLHHNHLQVKTHTVDSISTAKWDYENREDVVNSSMLPPSPHSTSHVRTRINKILHLPAGKVVCKETRPYKERILVHSGPESESFDSLANIPRGKICLCEEHNIWNEVTPTRGKHDHKGKGNVACIPAADRLRMNTNGLGRGAMTGSSVTTAAATESAPWGPAYDNIITSATARSHPRGTPHTEPPHFAPSTLIRGPTHAPPPQTERVNPLTLGQIVPSSQELPIFRPPLAPSSPTSRIFPASLQPQQLSHEQYPHFTTSGIPPLLSTSPVYQQLAGYYPHHSAFGYPGSGGNTSLALHGVTPYANVESYTDLLIQLRRSHPQAEAVARLGQGAMSSQAALHFAAPHQSPMGASAHISGTDQQSQRQSLTSHQTHATHGVAPGARVHTSRRSKSPTEKLSASPFRLPPLPTHLRAHPLSKLDSAIQVQRRPAQFRVPPSFSGSGASASLTEHTLRSSHDLSLSEPMLKRSRGEEVSGIGLHRVGEHLPSLSSSLLPATHSVASTISTSVTEVMTSAQSSQKEQQPPHHPRTAELYTQKEQQSRISSDGAAVRPSQPHYPPHFMRGSIIQLANGTLKRVEELKTEDFVSSADISPDLKIDSSQVVQIEERHESGTVVLGFSVGSQKLKVRVEATLEHPFFVFGQGWSSCSPEKTRQRYGLQCHELVVGDICISLTQKQADEPWQQMMSTQGESGRRSSSSDACFTQSAAQPRVRPNGEPHESSTLSGTASASGTFTAAATALRKHEEAHSPLHTVCSSAFSGSPTEGVTYKHSQSSDAKTQQQQSFPTLDQRLSQSKQEYFSEASSLQYVSVDSPGTPPNFSPFEESAVKQESPPTSSPMRHVWQAREPLSDPDNNEHDQRPDTQETTSS